MKKYKHIYFEDPPSVDFIGKSIRIFENNTTIIFINRRCSSVLSDEDLEAIYGKINDLLEKYDLFFLANVLDSCSLKISPIDRYKNIDIYPSKSPNGFYAVVSKKMTWSKIIRILEEKKQSISDGLNALVGSGRFSALTSWPRIYQTNDNQDFYPCRDESIRKKEISPEYQLSVYYFYVSCAFFLFFLVYFPKTFL